MAWTDEQKAEIFKAFYTHGEAASTIAARYSVSRNAIIGVATRMSALAGTAKKSAGVARTVNAVRKAQRQAGKPHARHMRAGSPIGKNMFRTPPPAADARFVPLADLGPNECRFAVTPFDAPRDGHLFCGAPADGPYCPRHSHIAYQRTPA